mmetsp:Transcript_96354/g.272508  ORF Transcript_96354/g.272508 Transcript_96354/m.272508 type:complete len:707 (-) Transcript_96354:305-2425(-)
MESNTPRARASGDTPRRAHFADSCSTPAAPIESRARPFQGGSTHAVGSPSGGMTARSLMHAASAGHCACGNWYMDDSVYCRKCGVKRSEAPATAQIRDAEMSVDFLCRKFEALSEQLRVEEQSREAVEQRGRRLTVEIESAEEAAAQRQSALAVELSANDSTLASLRVSASGMGQRAALQLERVTEERASEMRLEEACLRLTDECKAEAACVERTQAWAVAQDRETVQEQREHGELGRRLRSLQADMRVTLEDLRIAQQRALIVENEQQVLERGLGAASRGLRTSGQECEFHTQQVQDKQAQARDHDSRLEALVQAVEAARRENILRQQRLNTMDDDYRSSQMHLSALRQEFATAQHESSTVASEVHREFEANVALNDEVRAVDMRMAACAEEAAAWQRDVADVETTLGGVRQNSDHAQRARDTMLRQLDELTLEEQHHTKSAGGLWRSRQADDLAFESVQTELKAAFQKQEALSDELALHSRSRDALAVQLRRLRPEISEAEERCRHLEEQLAERSRELESELVMQGSAQQDATSASESLWRLQQQEAQLEAELWAVGAIASFVAAGAARAERAPSKGLPCGSGYGTGGGQVEAHPSAGEHCSRGSWLMKDSLFGARRAETSPKPAERCSCGNWFMADSVFCRKCGAKRGMAGPRSAGDVGGTGPIAGELGLGIASSFRASAPDLGGAGRGETRPAAIAAAVATP